jgi:hypothetical protein
MLLKRFTSFSALGDLEARSVLARLLRFGATERPSQSPHSQQPPPLKDSNPAALLNKDILHFDGKHS